MMYAAFFKRLLDLMVSLTALLAVLPILLVLMLVGAISMKGNPFFTQPGPGKKEKDGKEKIFRLSKLRTMSNAVDEEIYNQKQEEAKRLLRAHIHTAECVLSFVASPLHCVGLFLQQL